MESKEAIEIGKDILKVIESVSRGEKYEAMWEECKKDITRASVENWKVSAERFVSEMNKLEQKYFPKEEVDNDKTEI